MELTNYSSILEAIGAHAQNKPQALCMADTKKSLSYEQAWSVICNFAARLETMAKPGSYVVMECNQRCEFIIAMLAIQLAGFIAVPLERNAAASRISEICAQTNAAFFIGSKHHECIDKLPYIDFQDICECEEGFQKAHECETLCNAGGTSNSTGASDNNNTSSCNGASDGGSTISTNTNNNAYFAQSHFAMPQPDETAEILFSTGTTGKSKGIVITHGNNVAIAQNIACGCEAKPDNVEIIPVPLSHSHGLRTAYSNLYAGNAFVCCDGVLAVKVMFNLMEQYNVSAMDLVPSMLSIIFKLSKNKLGEYASQLDYIELGSAPLAEEDKEHLAALLPHTRLYNFYGSTESGRSCVLNFAAEHDRQNCIGHPAVNAKFIVVDANRNPIESSKENMGLLATVGKMNMKCYFDAPELTAQTMQDGYVYTKDLGYIDKNGYVYMLGREDDVINFGGIKISPEEIEHDVTKNPIVKDCALIAKNDKISGQIPKLYIQLEDGAQYDAKEFKKFLASALDANKQPQVIEVIEEIPRTYNGKIKRKELANRD